MKQETELIKLTDYHAKYFAYELTKRNPSDSYEKLASTLVDAQVDLNPHQVEAALFAFKSPFSKGAILADEVGLGKTIEAGLVISQRWAERKRRILVITPSNLRKQWHQELQEKFFLTGIILESKSYNAEIKKGNLKPFDRPAIIICSYQFAKSKAAEVQAMPWDLVVVDEAHRLRNVYKPTNVIANTLKIALQERHKILLTATPLQNSLSELYGLVSIIDERTFGDIASFREQYQDLSSDKTFEALKNRLKPVCHRTLRRQVNNIPFTKRHPIVQPFTPAESEDRLYNLVSDYLRRDNLQALPNSQRSLITLVLRKLLASSSFAIAGALEAMSARLRLKLAKQEPAPLDENLDQDYESLDATAEEWDDKEPEPPLSQEDRGAIQREIEELDGFQKLAVSITHNAKGQALLQALKAAFEKADKIGAARKAIIFTESRRTQSYLLRVLADSPYKNGVVLFNGTNTDENSKRIYEEWIARHAGTDRVSGSRSADMRAALVDYFREKGQIMIATEAGAEGINLQFCSLVVNYDLPWNPQRIEQRIGRCHRYGQKHDVVVVNFLNQKNEADQRVFRLLSEKFKLFEGVFGASDEVLGAIESGVDFEKRIADIYQKCRKPEEIKQAFDQLQTELKFEIDESISTTRRKLLENFDDDVRDKLRIGKAKSEAFLTRYEQALMTLTRHELKDHADFKDENSFELKSNPFGGDILLGLYELPRRSGEAHFYRINHPLAEQVLNKAKERNLEPVKIEFDYSGHEGQISILKPFVGQTGWLMASVLTVQSLDQFEDYLILAAMTEKEETLDEETARKLFSLGAASISPVASLNLPDKVKEITKTQQTIIQRSISERNAVFFETEAEKLDDWAEDLKLGLEREIKEMDKQIREARRSAAAALTLDEKLIGQKKMKALESQRNLKRRALFDAQDKIDSDRARLIEQIEGKLQQQVKLEELFKIRWELK